MAATRETRTPPPVIGKAGRYTVFLTPPSTPKPTSTPTKTESHSPKIAIPTVHVQPPPQQFDKPNTKSSSTSFFGFFWDAVEKVQNVHSSVDEYIADWFGLDQSKYQWALNDYYESKGSEKGDSKPKELANKGQGV